MASTWSQWLLWLCGLFFVGTIGFNVYRYVAIVMAHRSVHGPTYDFGDVYWGESKEHVFLVQNTGKLNLRINRVLSDCGCTTVGNQIAGKTIAPKESLDLPVRLAVGDKMDGRFAKTVIVQFADDTTLPIKLTITGNALPGLSFSSSVVTLNSSANEKSSQVITIRRTNGAPPISIAQVTTNSKSLSAKLAAIDSRKTGNPDEWQLAISSVPPLQKGRLKASVYVQTSKPAVLTHVLPVVVNVEE